MTWGSPSGRSRWGPAKLAYGGTPGPEEERRAFAERSRLYRQHPVGQGAFALPEVERKLGNLYRIRVGRLEADLAACQHELAALEGAEGPEP